MSRTSHPVEKGTSLAYKRWARRNVTSRPGNPAPRDVRRAEPRNRWNTIGRTRRRLAEILTAAINDPLIEVLPERISAMRLVGKARTWEDAHSWEAFPTFRDGGGGGARHVYSYSSMTDIVRAGGIEWIGKDGECIAASRRAVP